MVNGDTVSCDVTKTCTHRGKNKVDRSQLIKYPVGPPDFNMEGPSSESRGPRSPHLIHREPILSFNFSTV